MQPKIMLAVVLVVLSIFSQGYAEKNSDESAAVDLQLVADLHKGPGNITVTRSGKVIVSLHQFYDHDMRVAQINDDGQLSRFAVNAQVNSVLGLQADANEVVWLLDNAMRGGDHRRLVGWHESEQRMRADIDLTAVTNDQSFLNDLAVDPVCETIYIADPAGGDNAAIIVVNVADGSARRLLQGHVSVIPEAIDLIIDGTPVRIRAEDGSQFRPRIGINPIALDSSGDWLYYGPMHSHSLYRIRTADLQNIKLTDEDLAGRVERWSDKPICDGISIDDAGNIYLGDLANNAVGVIGPDRSYRQLIADPRLSWVDAFSFGLDQNIYLVANQLHRSAVLNAGTSITQPPYQIFKFKALSSGTPGR